MILTTEKAFGILNLPMAAVPQFEALLTEENSPDDVDAVIAKMLNPLAEKKGGWALLETSFEAADVDFFQALSYLKNALLETLPKTEPVLEGRGPWYLAKGKVSRETEKAWGVAGEDGRLLWVPKSISTRVEAGVVVPYWFAEKNHQSPIGGAFFTEVDANLRPVR